MMSPAVSTSRFTLFLRGVGVICAFLAGFLIYDSLLYVLPSGLHTVGPIYQVDYEELAIGIAALGSGAYMLFSVHRRLARPVPFLVRHAAEAALLAALLLAGATGFEVAQPSWFTSNDTVGVTINGRDELRKVRSRYLDDYFRGLPPPKL